MILQVENINKSFSDTPILKDINLQIEEGAIFGLLGPNGAGKTTLIRIINRILQQDSGKILFDHKEISDLNQKDIGYLPEERGLYKKMKVGEQAIYLGRLKGLSKSEAVKRLKEHFERFEILPWWNKKVEELSKGMQQKVQFIITILHQPKLLIFDEPFSGFDPINANLLKQEILDLKKNGTSIIFSTHNMNSVEELCENIALINNGNLVLKGAVNALKEQYKTGLYTLQCKGDKELPIVKGFKTIEQINIGQKITATIQKEKNLSINEYLSKTIENFELCSFEEILPGMDEIFIKTVENKL